MKTTTSQLISRIALKMAVGIPVFMLPVCVSADDHIITTNYEESELGITLDDIGDADVLDMEDSLEITGEYSNEDVRDVANEYSPETCAPEVLEEKTPIVEESEKMLFFEDSSEEIAVPETIDEKVELSAELNVDAQEEIVDKIESEETRISLNPVEKIEEEDLLVETTEDEIALIDLSAATNTIKESVSEGMQKIRFSQVFEGAPIVYSILISMSVFALSIFMYTFFSLQEKGNIRGKGVKELEAVLREKKFDKALWLCNASSSIYHKLVAAMIHSRNEDRNTSRAACDTEGERLILPFTQKITLLSDIAMIAPMVGLLGTVMGMFYAFYGLNRSQESVVQLFDGLGISVGTTVAGLFVAILATLLASISKYKLATFSNKMDKALDAHAKLIREEK